MSKKSQMVFVRENSQLDKGQRVLNGEFCGPQKEGIQYPYFDADVHQKSEKPKAKPQGCRDFIAVPQGRSEEQVSVTQRQLYLEERDGYGLQWDPENRLRCGWRNGSEVYSAFRDWNGRAFCEIEETFYTDRVFDGWNPVYERTVDGLTEGQVAEVTYVWGTDLSGSLRGAGGVGGLLAVNRDGDWYVPLYDANGNVTAYVSEGGSVVAEYEYDAFGNTISQSGAMSDDFRHRFSTKPWIAPLSVYDYGERIYSPQLRRWLSRDPIEESGGVNLYAMCGNDLLGKFDSYGLFSFCRQNGEIKVGENQQWKLVNLDYMKNATHDIYAVVLSRIVAVWELEGNVQCCCRFWCWSWKKTIPVKKQVVIEIPLEPVVTAQNASSLPIPPTFPFSIPSAVGTVLGASGEMILNNFFTSMSFHDRTDIYRIADEVSLQFHRPLQQENGRRGHVIRRCWECVEC